MNFSRTWIGSLAAFLLSSMAFAADSSPAGEWQWTVQGQRGQGFEQSVRLDYKDGKLTGIMPGREAGRFSVPDTPISDASFKDGLIKFAITRELNGRSFTTRYEGRLEGDTITGTFKRDNVNRIERDKNKDVAPRSEWIAKRKT